MARRLSEARRRRLLQTVETKSRSTPTAPYTPALPPGTMESTLAVIMGGGAGTRLFPLTKDRAKPAEPLAGKYPLVDIPISNSLNSGPRASHVLTQFSSVPLPRHIPASDKSYNFPRH